MPNNICYSYQYKQTMRVYFCNLSDMHFIFENVIQVSKPFEVTTLSFARLQGFFSILKPWINILLKR